MALYSGTQHSGGAGAQLVTKDDDILSPAPSQKIYNHSPDGFNWGYAGSGPAQLALALLYDVAGNQEIALANYQDFKREFVASWGDRWQITTDEIMDWLIKQRQGGVR